MIVKIYRSIEKYYNIIFEVNKYVFLLFIEKINIKVKLGQLYL